MSAKKSNLIGEDRILFIMVSSMIQKISKFHDRSISILELWQYSKESGCLTAKSDELTGFYMMGPLAVKGLIPNLGIKKR